MPEVTSGQADGYSCPLRELSSLLTSFAGFCRAKARTFASDG